MKKSTVFCLFTFFIALSFLSNADAQTSLTVRGSIGPMKAMTSHPIGHEGWAGARHESKVPLAPLDGSVALPAGVDSLPVVGSFAFQSDGRPLHNIQIDPSNPMNIHVVITDATDPSAADTAQLLTRRCFYTFSSDGGMTWKPPVTFSTVRTGYADLQLFKRNGKYVPIIAAHRVTAPGAATLEIGLWIEKGNPGDGNFSESLAPRVTADGVANTDIAWPTMAMSPNNDTAYVVGVVSPGPDQLQFGRFILDAAQDSAVFDSSQWDAAPGEGDATNPDAGLCGAGGAARIRVSPSGTVGVAWINANDAGQDDGLYFAESTDGGNTWPTTLTPIFEPANGTADANGAYAAPIWGNVDFWYANENPKFIFNIGATLLGQGKYYPSTSGISFTDSSLAQFVNVISPYFTTAQDAAAFAQTLPPGSTLDVGNPIISWPTVALTSDSNTFAVFYQVYVEGDTEQINSPADPSQDTSYCYGSIYYQLTQDGGATWTPATPLLSASDYTPKLDFRQPMTSDFNPINASGANFSIVTVVDTAPGNLVQNGMFGFDMHDYVMASTAFSAVNVGPSQPSGLAISAYPDPAVSSSTIQFTVPTEVAVRLTVSDMLGRTVKTLVSGMVSPGQHSVPFDAAHLPNGVYRYTLEANGASVSKSMSIMR